MKLKISLLFCLLLTGCAKNSNKDPFESFNRPIYGFNDALDTTVLRPTSQIYKALLPSKLRLGINNFFNNINMLPTMANDILQVDFEYLIKDFWRFVLNSSLGIAGIFDVAQTPAFNLPPHSNDVGLTLAKWGMKESPYIVIPILGPSTIRDGLGIAVDFFLLSPYPYLAKDSIIWPLIALRFVDLRAKMLENDKYIAEAMDKYTFVRDAYLQHRQYLISGKEIETTESLYVDADVGPADYVEEEELGG